MPKERFTSAFERKSRKKNFEDIFLHNWILLVKGDARHKIIFIGDDSIQIFHSDSN